MFSTRDGRRFPAGNPPRGKEQGVSSLGRGIEVASVIDRKGLARAGSWFVKSTFLPLIADIYISISMETFEHRKYKVRGENGNN